MFCFCRHPFEQDLASEETDRISFEVDPQDFQAGFYMAGGARNALSLFPQRDKRQIAFRRLKLAQNRAAEFDFRRPGVQKCGQKMSSFSGLKITPIFRYPLEFLD